MTKRSIHIVQQLAAGQMLQSVKIERVQAPGYDPVNLVATPGSRATIYTGKARIWEQENPSMVQMSETDFLAYQTILSLPADSGANVHLLDEVEITASPTDAVWIGARFRIQNAKFGGNLRATRSFVVERITPRA